jgi:hypothetical protein
VTGWKRRALDEVLRARLKQITKDPELTGSTRQLPKDINACCSFE